MKDCNLLIKKLINKAEFVDRCTWVLGSENGRNAFVPCNSVGDFKKALSANYSCYYISPDVFSGDFRFENVFFEGRPNGLSVDVGFRLQLFPETLGFADWVKENVSFELSKEAFVEKIRATKYGLKDFLQEWFVFAHDDKLDFGLLQKYGKGALREYVGQSRYVEPWLHIDGMQWIKVDDIPASERESLEKFNEIQRKHADELKALREKTAFEVSKINIEEALAIAQRNQRLAEVSRQLEIKRFEADIAKANAEKAEAELRELQAKKAKEGLTNQQSERLISLQEGITQYYKELKWRDSRIEELESLIDSLTRELAELRKKFSDKDWYDGLSVKEKILAYIKLFLAEFLLMTPILCAAAFEVSISVCVACFFYVSAFVLLFGFRRVKLFLLFIKQLVVNGRIECNLSAAILDIARFVCGSMLWCVMLGIVLQCVVGWIDLLFWFLGVQLNLYQLIPFCMGSKPWEDIMLIGMMFGAWRFLTLLLLYRRIRASKEKAWKWFVIIVLPIMLFSCIRGSDSFGQWRRQVRKDLVIFKVIKAYEKTNYTEFWRLVEDADDDNPKILLRLSEAYFNGFGLNAPDYSKARRCYKKLLKLGGGKYLKKAKNGLIKAEDALAKSKEINELKNKTEDAISAFNKKNYKLFWELVNDADKEDVRIIVRIGDAYKRGYGVEIDLMRAIKEYEKIRNVKAGSQRAFFEWLIAACYHDLSNYDKAAEYARFAINNGCCEAWLLIGSYIEQELAGYKINLEEAKKCYEKALMSSNAVVKKNAQEGVERVKSKIKALRASDKGNYKVSEVGFNLGLDEEKRLCDDEIYRNFTTKHSSANIESRRIRWWEEIESFYPNVMDNLSKMPLFERCRVAFYFAAFSCEKSILYILDKKILDINDVADGGFLHFAAGAGDEKMVDFLIAQGADVNKQDKDGQAPISWAGLSGDSLRMIKHLVERHGAKIIKVNDEESLFMDVLKRDDRIDVLKYLIEKRGYLPTSEELTKIHTDSYYTYVLGKNKVLRTYIESKPWEKGTEKTAAKREKEAHKAFAGKDWKTGFDTATNLTINSISDSYVTYHVGYCYSPTYGTDYPKKKDYEKAYEWFKHTAELEQKSGDGIVQCILGDMEMNGQGCATNIDNAVAWYRISAERKYNRGCYELGKCYEDNIVVDTNDNLVAAKNWYFKAMSLKYKPAKEAYVRVVKRVKERDAVSKIIWNYDVDKKEWEYDSELLRRFASVHKDYQRKYVYVKVFMDGKGMSKASNLRLFTIVNKLLDLGIGADKIICSYQEEDVDMMMGPFNLGGITELTIIDKIPNRTTIKGSRLVKDSEKSWRCAYFLALAKAMDLYESKK